MEEGNKRLAHWNFLRRGILGAIVDGDGQAGFADEQHLRVENVVEPAAAKDKTKRHERTAVKSGEQGFCRHDMILPADAGAGQSRSGMIAVTRELDHFGSPFCAERTA